MDIPNEFVTTYTPFGISSYLATYGGLLQQITGEP